MKQELHFDEPSTTSIDGVLLTVRTARTGRTGPEANIEAEREKKIIHQDWVKIDRAEERRKFAAQIHKRAPHLDLEELERCLLTFCQGLIGRITAESQSAQPTSSNAYFEEDGLLFWNKPTADGPRRTKLCNFTGEIVADTIWDDGAQEHHFYDMRVLCNGKEHELTVAAEDFHAMRWVPAIGGTAVITPTNNAPQHIRYAIQQCSMGQKSERVFGHTGWRKEQGVWRYLHAGGGVGAEGNDSGIRVDLVKEGLAAYSLPDPPQGENLKAAVRASLALLDVSAPTITIPLLAAVYRAPLSQAIPSRVTVFLEGETGSFKTALTALAQAHYGSSFNGESLPGGWSSTDNALEKKLFLAKDAVLVIDDFKPVGSHADMQAFHKAADRVIRAQGNLQGRSRMNADTQLHPTYDPRGLMISSGEETPGGHSLRARMVIVEVEKSATKLDRLSALQQDAQSGLLAAAMAGYLQWLAPQVDELKNSTRHEELREQARREHTFPHERTADEVASLAVGLEVFLKFAEDVGAIDGNERDRLWEEGWKTLIEVGLSQHGEQSEEDDALRFLELVEGGIASGRAHIADAKTLGAPPEGVKWGWPNGASRGPCVGWLDGENLFLATAPGYTLARKLAQEQGQYIGRRETLWKRLGQKGYLVSSDKRRGTVRRSFGGPQQRCLHLRSDALFL